MSFNLPDGSGAALDEALEIIAYIVSQANVNRVMDGDSNFVVRYDMPVGSIDKAIPYLEKHGLVVDDYGAIHGPLRGPLEVKQ